MCHVTIINPLRVNMLGLNGKIAGFCMADEDIKELVSKELSRHMDFAVENQDLGEAQKLKEIQEVWRTDDPDYIPDMADVYAVYRKHAIADGDINRVRYLDEKLQNLV